MASGKIKKPLAVLSLVGTATTDNYGDFRVSGIDKTNAILVSIEGIRNASYYNNYFGIIVGTPPASNNAYGFKAITDSLTNLASTTIQYRLWYIPK